MPVTIPVSVTVLSVTEETVPHPSGEMKNTREENDVGLKFDCGPTSMRGLVWVTLKLVTCNKISPQYCL